MKYRLESFLGILFLLSIVSCGGKQNGKVADAIDSSYIKEVTVDSAAYMDSVARSNFISYDLTFNELHGDVKEVKYQTPTSPWDIVTCKFDEDGNWLNVPEWSKDEKINNKYCPGKPDHQTIRDKEGRISKIYFACETDWDYFEYEWIGGSLKGNTLGDFTYSRDGYLISSEEDDIQYTKNIYTDYVLDGMGNWIERTVNSFTYDEEGALVKEVRKEKRDITYFKSNPQGRFPLENTSEQTNLLAQEKNKYKKASEQSKQQVTEIDNGQENFNPKPEPVSIYSTPAGREAYLEVLRLQREVKDLINASAKYRRILSYSTDPYEYQMAGIENSSLLQEAVKKQRKAISIAESTLKDPKLLNELNGQLQLLLNELYK